MSEDRASPISGVVPPKEYRFVKGVSGNPSGRSKGKNLTTVLREFLELEIEGKNPVDGEPITLTIKEIIMLRRVKNAIDGSEHAIENIIDRLEGKPLQRTENKNTTPEGIKLTIVHKSIDEIKNEPTSNDGDAAPQQDTTDQDENSSQ